MTKQLQLQMRESYILIRRERTEERKTPGGVVLPAKAGETPAWGTVVSVGPGAAPEVHPGDRVLVGRYAGNDVKVGEETLVVVPLADIFGVELAAGDARCSPAASING